MKSVDYDAKARGLIRLCDYEGGNDYACEECIATALRAAATEALREAADEAERTCVRDPGFSAHYGNGKVMEMNRLVALLRARADAIEKGL